MSMETERELERAIRSVDRLGPRLQLCHKITTLRNTPAVAIRLFGLAALSAGATLATSVVDRPLRTLLVAVTLLMPVFGSIDVRRVVQANDLGVTLTNVRKRFVAWHDIGRIEYRRGRVKLYPLVGAPIVLRALTSFVPGPGRAVAGHHAAILSEECARARARGVLGAIG
jgi:hypothetical protein